jgi:hypothetical protein
MATIALFVAFDDLRTLIVLVPLFMQLMIGEVEGSLVYVEDPLHVAMRTNEELMGLFGLCLITHLGERTSPLVCCAAIYVVMLAHKATDCQ